MVKRMLIDATHPEETRVVVLNGNKLDEFDYETTTKLQLKGNIYLAKVTRVEPSLQAAFVEYGGNRQGFLAFGEIHPDYYRIPVADREALLAEVAGNRAGPSTDFDPEPTEALPPPSGNGAAEGGHVEAPADGAAAEAASEAAEDGHGAAPAETIETVGGDEVEEVQPRRVRNYRHYKIQEVITRRQIMLVQVVKEERGTKGAALTTYLSLAGRYCVLMPNTPRGGGVSRKITNPQDRARLKEMLDEFELPEGMAVIVRTAGMERAKPEIRRDYEYLLRLWNDIRELTLQSTAPALIHEEGNLITRAIRDLYTRDIDEIQVEGEEGYRAAKSFMNSIVPSHGKRVQAYRDPVIPLFHRYQVESQIDLIHSPTVQLKSGGYIVINPTEALVSIDVNSGRATRERHIEETALKTNLEAADEIARQLRLRDLAGLIVIDFIDMEENRNNHAVERRLKEAMKSDRARIQIGRISPFGLLELSRQRLRPSIAEISSHRCPHCAGSGLIRSTESTALSVLRAIEEEGIRGKSAEILVYVPTAVALYILNQKRAMLASIEMRYHMAVQIGRDDALIPPDFRLERLRQRLPGELPPPPPMVVPIEEDEDEEVFEETAEAEEQAGAVGAEPVAAEDADGGRRSKRRRRSRKRRREDDSAMPAEAVAAEGPADETMAEAAEGEEADEGAAIGGDAEVAAADELGEDGRAKRRRRGKRGGRRRLRTGADLTAAEAEGALPPGLGEQPEVPPEAFVRSGPVTGPMVGPTVGPNPDLGAAPPAETVEPAPVVAEPAPVIAEPTAMIAETAPEPAAEAVPVKPKRAPRKRKAAEPAAEPAAAEPPAAEAAPKPKRAPRKRKAVAAPEAEPEPAPVVDIAAATAADVAPTVAQAAAEPPATAEPALAPAPERPAAEPAAPVAPESATAVVQPEIPGVAVNVIDRPVENPRGGWWRRKA